LSILAVVQYPNILAVVQCSRNASILAVVQIPITSISDRAFVLWYNINDYWYRNNCKAYRAWDLNKAVRILLFNYKKAFYLIDHGIMVEEISTLPISSAIVR
jgi:hypothetical protein